MSLFLPDVFCTVCQCSFSPWCPLTNQTGLEAGDFQGPARVPLHPFPCPLAGWMVTGGEAWPLWSWMDEEIKTSTGPTVPKHQKEQWHGGGFDHEANTGGERGWFRGGGGTPAHGAHKKTLTHRCKDIVCKCVDMDTLCMHNHTLSHTHACTHALSPRRRRSAVHFDAHLCLYLRRSHTIARPGSVSPWMPLKSGLDLARLDFDTVCHCICQIVHTTPNHAGFENTWAISGKYPEFAEILSTEERYHVPSYLLGKFNVSEDQKQLLKLEVTRKSWSKGFIWMWN